MKNVRFNGRWDHHPGRVPRTGYTGFSRPGLIPLPALVDLPAPHIVSGNTRIRECVTQKTKTRGAPFFGFDKTGKSPHENIP
jgi:hypothetical protein